MSPIRAAGPANRSDVSNVHVHVDQRPGVVEWPTSVAEVQTLVLEHLRERYGSDIEADETCDVKLEVDGVRLWVEVAEPAAILLRAPVVLAVRSRQQTDTELNVANRNNHWVRWVRGGKHVWQELALPASPFVPQQFDRLLAMFVDICWSTRPDMADRLYGQMAR